MADHAPQANAGAVAAHMLGMGNLFPQVMEALDDRITDLENQVNAMPVNPQDLQQIQRDIRRQARRDAQQIRLRLDDLVNQQQEAHIRILNHFAPADAPLSYPVGTDHDALHALAHTKAEANNISDAEAHMALTHLGVEDIPQAAVARRHRFLEYIGIYLY